MLPFMLLDDAVAGYAFHLHGFVYQDVLDAAHLSDLDKCLQKGWAQGWYAGVVVDYEFGLPLQNLPSNHQGYFRLLWFTEKDRVDDVDDWLIQADGANKPAGISMPYADVGKSDYLDGVAAVQQAIARGETYQINYTHRLHVQVYGSPIRLYHRLRQNVPYGALLCLPKEGNIENWVLCFSPELFLRVDKTGTAFAEPMKGTAPRLGDDNDEQRALNLGADAKNRAENTMIVDLLRNDLGKIAQVGGVSVPEPFKVSAFGSVWQMTTTIKAKLLEQTSVADIIYAAFPCGSITGAPKRKSMEMIAKLEHSPRGLYTGCIGWIDDTPDSVLGFTACLNVVIRTLCVQRDTVHANIWQGIYGVGSGIVADSMGTDEYAECGWKSRFLRDLSPEFGLFETMRVERGVVLHLSEHLCRLSESAKALNILVNMDYIRHYVSKITASLPINNIFRLRLNVSANAEISSEITVLKPLIGKQKVCLSPNILANDDVLRRYKITYRYIFDQTWRDAVQRGAFDALLFNENGDLLEGGRSAVMIEYRGQKYVPSLDLDILDSITRRRVLVTGDAKETSISREMLFEAKKVWLGNALHGWFEVELM